MSEFNREDRYLVIKSSDLDNALRLLKPKFDMDSLCWAVDKVRKARHRGPLCAVVIEHDWPEYEPVWKMIEERVKGIKTTDDFLEESYYLWFMAMAICPDRDNEADEIDPGNGPHCKHTDNESGMAWCEPGSCPRARF